MLVSAQTGSGKTVAFGLALSSRLLGEAERFERAAEPLALIIAPTRELAVQVQRELAWLYAETGARIASCVGGMDPRAERDALRDGAHIVVGTPGRLRDHLERGRLDLTKLRAAVLDEADEMLDLGFRDDLQFILDATPAERQTLLFSATVPREIESLARSYQRDALRIATAVRNQQHDDIEYRAVRTVPHAIEPTVVNLLRYYDAPATLVFCATREGVRRLHAGLLDRGFAAVALSGELSQAERTLALDQLRHGRAKVLVATDVAARGLDLAELSLVIHADLPNDGETLLHRSGRTGRAGRKGTSVLVVPPNKRRRAEELLGRSRINAAWANAPTAREIAKKDQERLLSMPILDELATAEDLELGRALLDGRTPEQVAAALVRMHRAALPVPEQLKDHGRPAAPNRARNDARERTQRPAHERAQSHAGGGDGRHSKLARERAAQDRSEAGGIDVRRTEATPAQASEVEAGPGEPGQPEAGRPQPRRLDPTRTASTRSEKRGPERSPAHDGKSFEHKPFEKRPYGKPADRDRPADASRPRPEARARKDHRDMVWFGLNIGREKNADPRWLLPLICRVGGVTKSEIGTIRIEETVSRFEILAEHADNFANAVRLNKHREGRIWRIDDGAEGEPSSGAPEPSRTARPAGHEPARARHTRREDRSSREKHPPQSAQHAGPAGHAERRFKPNGGKPGAAGAADRHPARKAYGGNGTLKRSWKGKTQQS